MRLSIEHTTRYQYDPPAQRLHLRLKLYPISTASQTVRSWQVTVDGEPIEPLLTSAYGDAEALVATRRRADQIEIRASGLVETSDAAGVLGRIGHARPQVFLRDTMLTEADDAVRQMAQAASTQAGDQLGQMHALSGLIAETLDYRQGATDSGTSAAQTLAIGAGVCQDFTHLFIAAARAVGIPARYVVGYLHDRDEPLSETHAWAETHLDGLGWVGFDPVNQLCPTDAYIRLCTGFDAADAAPLRGTLAPGSHETLDVAVSVAEAQAQSQQQ